MFVRSIIVLIFVLAALRGLIYACFLPPWGLIDEAQHVHYIQYVAEQGKLPVIGQTHLSQEIVDSLFATKHWLTFHWATPASTIPAEMGLVGHSYEAYQPPLFYTLLSPIFLRLPGNILTKLFLLRWSMVLMSMATLGIVYRAASLFWSQESLYPLFALLLFSAIPERTFAVSRVNNDVLLEVLAALFLLQLTLGMSKSLSVRRNFGVGLLLGLGMWAKFSMFVLVVPMMLVLWFQRNQSGWGRCVWAACSGVALLAIPLILTNLWRFGDVTGFAQFRLLHTIVPPEWSFPTIVRALADLFRHTWLIWWKGASAEANVVVNGFQIVLLLLTGTSAWKIGQQLWPLYRSDTCTIQCQILVTYVVTVIAYGLAVLSSYFLGMIPVVQGRFLLPAFLPIVLLLVWGFSQYTRGLILLSVMIALLFVLDTLSIWGNLLPYFYYWSAPGQDAVTGITPLGNLSVGSVGWLMTLRLVSAHLVADKPAFIVAILPWLFCAYVLLSAYTWLYLGQRAASTLK